MFGLNSDYRVSSLNETWQRGYVKKKNLGWDITETYIIGGKQHMMLPVLYIKLHVDFNHNLSLKNVIKYTIIEGS